MNALLDILAEGNPCPLILAIVILLAVGGRLGGEQYQRLGYFLAGAALLAYGAYAWWHQPPQRAEDLLSLTVRAVVAGGLALGLSWIVLPLALALWEHAVAWPCGWGRAVRRRLRERQARRAEQERQRRYQAEAAQAEPARQQAAQEAEVRARAEAEAQRRRENTRAACELLFSLHAPELGARFPREVFADYCARYLGDNHPPDYVEQRARKLQDVLRQHLEKVCPTPGRNTLEDMAAAYQREKEQIEASGLDEEAKQTLLATARGRFFHRLQQEMEQP